MPWIKAISGALGVIGMLWVAANTVATKSEVKEAKAEVHGEVIIVAGDLERHTVDDEIFYTNRRIWQVKEQTQEDECRHIQKSNLKEECMRLELRIDSLEKRREALTR